MRLRLIGLATRYYRKIKAFLLTRHPPLVTPLFFLVLRLVDRILSGRRQTKEEKLATMLWKQSYLAYWAQNKALRLRLETEHPLAGASDDHKHPRGAIFDNSVNYGFNLKLYQSLGFRENIFMMDLGCAGGGLVRSFLEDGHTAIGLEGSDISKRLRSGEWDTIPYHLFPCDITKPFRIVDAGGAPVLFDAITSWEVLEHIPKAALAGLIANIKKHLRPGGLFIGSVDMLPDGNPLTGAVYHVTLESKAWWLAQFAEGGLIEAENHGFATQDMVRGSGLSLKDWRPEDGGGFHLVLRKA